MRSMLTGQIPENKIPEEIILENKIPQRQN